MWRDAFIRDMTHSYEMYLPGMKAIAEQVTWLIATRHSYVIWRIHMGRDSIIWRRPLRQKGPRRARDMTHCIHMWHASLHLHVTWLIVFIHISSHSYVTWLIHMTHTFQAWRPSKSAVYSCNSTFLEALLQCKETAHEQVMGQETQGQVRAQGGSMLERRVLYIWMKRRLSTRVHLCNTGGGRMC